MIPERSNRIARLLLFTDRIGLGNDSGDSAQLLPSGKQLSQNKKGHPCGSRFFERPAPVKSPPFTPLEKYPKIKFDK